jgi:hypothetical protein
MENHEIEGISNYLKSDSLPLLKLWKKKNLKPVGWYHFFIEWLWNMIFQTFDCLFYSFRSTFFSDFRTGHTPWISHWSLKLNKTYFSNHNLHKLSWLHV